MTKVINSASLHPKTVTNYRDHVRVTVPSRSKRGSRMRVLRVDRRVLETAKKLADGDLRRLEIRSETCVVVRN